MSRTSQARCLFDRGRYEAKLDHNADGTLPGERFDADQQCMLKYGKDSIQSQIQPVKEICRDLHCQRDRYTWTSHPALEGTGCGESKVMVTKRTQAQVVFFLLDFHCNWFRSGAAVANAY